MIRSCPCGTVAADQTDIDADQIIDLRTVVNCVRAWYGLGGFNWTDPTLTENQTVISAAHIENLRTALDAAYTAAGYTAPEYDDPRRRKVCLQKVARELFVILK